MQDLDQMTDAERARVAACIEAQRPRRMRRPDGRELTVSGDLVESRIQAGYVLIDES